MKKLFTILAVLLITSVGFAQVPEKMSYQAVVRNTSNALVTSSPIGMQISILQGSSTGTPVYIETQTPNTNANGLVSLEIGNGIVITGIFSTIDWSNGPYFIKTETDPTGGISYTITGTSQLLSVPYALHAKTAEAISGTITETDPIFVASIASGINGADTTNWNNKLDMEVDGSVTNEIQTISRAGTTVTLSNGGGTFQDSISVYTAGAGINITSNIISTVNPCGLAIGQTYQGGIIFYIDPSGCHGLICTPTDISAGASWDNGSYIDTKTYTSGLFEGKYNTERIQSSQGGTTSASAICLNLSLAGYDDWYLPSIHELNVIYQNIGPGNTLSLGNLVGFSSGNYWSSTEFDLIQAWIQPAWTNIESYTAKFQPLLVRAVRTF